MRATAAPISEVLDRIARETGMKVTYDGAPPRARVSVTLTGVTPAQAVLAVLEGQGLNYALRMDPRAVRIETLLMVAGSGAGAPVPAVRPQPGPRPIDREPDITEPEEEAPPEAPAPAPEEQRRPFPFPGGASPFGTRDAARAAHAAARSHGFARRRPGLIGGARVGAGAPRSLAVPAPRARPQASTAGNVRACVAPEEARLAGQEDPLVVLRPPVEEPEAVLVALLATPAMAPTEVPPAGPNAEGGGVGLGRGLAPPGPPVGIAGDGHCFPGTDEPPFPALHHGVLVLAPEVLSLDQHFERRREGVAVLALVFLDGARDLVAAEEELLLAVVLHDVAPGGHGRAHHDHHDGDPGDDDHEGESALALRVRTRRHEGRPHGAP